MHLQLKTPQVTTISYLSRDAVIITSALTYLTYLTIAPSYEHTEWAPFFSFGAASHRFFTPGLVRVIWGVVITLHSLEALYVGNLCRKHTSFGIGVS